MKFFWKIIALSTVLAILILFLPSILQAPSKIITNESSFGNAQAEEFILIGDTGTGSKEQYKVAESIKNYCATKNCKAVFILGDVIYDKGVSSISDEQFKTKFEDPYKEIQLPFYIVFGNHDYLGCVDCYIKYSSVSKKWEMPERFYVTKFENVT